MLRQFPALGGGRPPLRSRGISFPGLGHPLLGATCPGGREKDGELRRALCVPAPGPQSGALFSQSVPGRSGPYPGHGPLPGHLSGADGRRGPGQGTAVKKARPSIEGRAFSTSLYSSTGTRMGSLPRKWAMTPVSSLWSSRWGRKGPWINRQREGWRGSGPRRRATGLQWSCPGSPPDGPAPWPPRGPPRRRCPPGSPPTGPAAGRRSMPPTR